MEISDLRTEYTRHGLSEGELTADPMEQFRRWFESAVEAGVREPNAMTLATVDGEGRPAARIVLLKGAESDGFGFFTNYESAKGRELGRRPEAALVFFWSELERQVRVEGPVERLAAAWGLDATTLALRAGHIPDALRAAIARDPEGFRAWAE